MHLNANKLALLTLEILFVGHQGLWIQEIIFVGSIYIVAPPTTRSFTLTTNCLGWDFQIEILGYVLRITQLSHRLCKLQLGHSWSLFLSQQTKDNKRKKKKRNSRAYLDPPANIITWNSDVRRAKSSSHVILMTWSLTELSHVSLEGHPS